MAQPIVIQDAISIAANSVNNNVIASNDSLKILQMLPAASKVTVLAVASATGLQIDFDIGSSNVIAESNLRVSASTPENPFDVVNDEIYGQQGDLMSLKAANTTGGAITLRYMIIAEPLAEAGVMVQLPPNHRVTQQGPTSVANNTVDLQLLDGLRLERPSVDSILDVLMTQSAAGMFRSLFVDSERIAPPSAISLANRIPQDPLDMTVTGVEVEANKEIQLSITNQSGGALNVFWKIILKQLVRI